MIAQATKAIFRHGDPRMIDYTPGADVAAGDVISLGNTAGLACGVAHVAIANAAKGALAVGGGVYQGIMIGNYANYTLVYWDADGKFNTTSTNNEQFGYIVSGGGGGANAVVDVLHVPQTTH